MPLPHFTRRLYCGVLLLLSISFSSPLALAQKGRIEPILNYAELFESIVKTTRENFYDKNLHGKNLDEIAGRYRMRATEVKSKRAFATLVNQMLDELQASHFELLTDEDFGYYLLRSVLERDIERRPVAHIGVMGRYEKEEYVVTGVLDGSPAAVAGILVGDRLKSVQGEPFRTIQSFREMEGKSLSLSYTRGNENRTTSVIPKKENILRAFLDATRKSARTYVVNGKKIGYVHLWTMGHDLFKQLLDQIVLGELHSTDGLILDLRDGFGGNPWGFSEAFFTPDVEWQQDTRGAKIIRRIGYGKPMVVLTNAGTRSAKEFLAYQFKKTGRAILVGTNTAGAFLGATGFPLKQGLYLEIPIVGLSLDGKRLEAKGVAPDIVVEAQAPYTEQDAQLQKAKETLLTRMTRRLTVQN